MLSEIATPQVILALDCAVLLALTVAIAVGLQILRRLRRLNAARTEWLAELDRFSERADAAESGLERLRIALLAEAETRRARARVVADSKAVRADARPAAKAGPTGPFAKAQSPSAGEARSAPAASPAGSAGFGMKRSILGMQ